MRSIIICSHLWSGLSVSQSRFNDVFLAQRPVLLRTLQRMVGNHEPGKSQG
ncbi:RNA polymerase sigma-70 family protein, partial [Pseudomonas syringae pv. daphniphylli]